MVSGTFVTTNDDEGLNYQTMKSGSDVYYHNMLECKMGGVSNSSPMSLMANSSTSSNSSTSQSFTEFRNRRRRDYDRDDSTQSSHCTINSGGTMGLTRSKTRNIFSSSEKFQSHPDLKDLYERQEELDRLGFGRQEMAATLPDGHLIPTKYFGRDIKKWTDGKPDEPVFNKGLRDFIETHISKARRTREQKQLAVLKQIGADSQNIPISAVSNSYVPYPALRHEQRFLYDVDTYPLHEHLAEIFGVKDLSLIHEHPIQDKKELMKPLLDTKKRLAFHKCYDNFVTSFCIPFLHAQAIGENYLNDSWKDNGQQRISYRYQAFPCIRVNRPGEFSIGPHCDMSYGHSMGNINFHIPLTPTYGTNALYTESHPGREDWHPLKTKAIGLGYSFDGARCLHFTLENSTIHTRVSLDFRIAIHRVIKMELPASVTPRNAKMMMDYSVFMKEALGGDDDDDRFYDVHDILCNKEMLKDNYSSFPGYYEDALVEFGATTSSSSAVIGPGPVVCKRISSKLMQPDKRVGFPF